MVMRDQVREDLLHTLRQHDIELHEPRDRMVQLNGVAAGEDYSKPQTNVLLRQRDARTWEIFVDEDFYYVGKDRLRREQFCGSQASRWSQVRLVAPLHGDINEVIVRGLRLLDSPIASELADDLDGEFGLNFNTQPDEEPTHLQHRLQVLGSPRIRPTPTQSELIERAVEIVSRREPPTCPVLIGPAGSGRSSLAALIAAELLRRKTVGRVVQLAGATLQCGTLFPPQRDKRLHDALCEVEQGPDTLLILEQLELACDRSVVAVSILADALERGVRLVTTAAPELRCHLLDPPRLLRRVEPLRIRSMPATELTALLEQRLQQHALSQQRDIADELIPVIIRLSSRRPGANPGAAAGLLDAVLTHAAWSPARCVGPDDVYHVMRRTTQ